MKKRALGHYLPTAALTFAGFIAFAHSSAAGFRFVAWGDATDLLPYVVTNAAQIGQLSVQPRFSLFAGDLYDTGFTTLAADALRNAIDTGNSNGLSATMFPVRGNHDILGGAAATAGWQSYFDLAATVSTIGGSNYAYMTGCSSLTYSFDYQNYHFVGLDIPGDVTLIQPSQLAWLDGNLAAAEARALQHAFLFWHGPAYSSGSRHGGIDAPADLVAVLNKHPIVSAIFGGHAHVFAWTHMFTNRIAAITHPFEAFIVPPVAENLASMDDTNRCDYGLGGIRGFATVDVNGPSFTVSLYVQDVPAPVFTKTFPSLPVLRFPELKPAGEFQFLLQGEQGRIYQIETSIDGKRWFPLATNLLLAPQGALVAGPLDQNLPLRFFRCVWSPGASSPNPSGP